MVEEHREAHASEWAVLQSIAPKLGCTAATLRTWVRQAHRDTGHRPGLTTSEREGLNALEREVRELNRANEILREASAYVAQRSPTAAASSHDGVVHRRAPGALRVESICTLLPIAPPTYHATVAKASIRRSARRGRAAMTRCASRSSASTTSAAPDSQLSRRYCSARATQ